MPPASFSIRARCSRFQVANVVLRFVKSFSGPPEPSSRYDGPGSGLADPARVGLRRDRVAKVLERVEDVHRAVLDAVLVAGHETAADPAVVARTARRRSAGASCRRGARSPGCRPTSSRRARSPCRARGCRRPSPARRSRGHSSRSQPCSVMSGQTPVAISWSIARIAVHRDVVAAHDLHRDVHQPLGVRQLGAPLQRAVDEERGQVRVVGLARLAQLGLLLGQLDGSLIAVLLAFVVSVESDAGQSLRPQLDLGGELGRGARSTERCASRPSRPSLARAKSWRTNSSQRSGGRISIRISAGPAAHVPVRVEDAGRRAITVSPGPAISSSSPIRKPDRPLERSCQRSSIAGWMCAGVDVLGARPARLHHQQLAAGLLGGSR